MDYKINFDDQIPQMIEQFKQTHVDFKSSFKKQKNALMKMRLKR
jgi:hypothetical protein